MTVKRWSVGVDGPDENGNLVAYADYLSLATENSSLRLTIDNLESGSVSDVIAERQRQIDGECYTTQQDDKYVCGELAGAASCYARHASERGSVFYVHKETYKNEVASNYWPWHQEAWKPTSPRRDLVKAAALILAEIERIDRSGGKAS